MITLSDEIIKGNIHFPLCDTCHQPMDWLQVFRDGQPIRESLICRYCHEYEAKTLSLEGEETILVIKKLRTKTAWKRG